MAVRWWTVLCTAAVLSMLSAGCDDQGASPDDGAMSTSEGSQVTDGTEPTAGEGDFRVTDVEQALVAVSESLQTQQLTPRFASAQFAVCEGGEADTFVDTSYSYVAQGRTDYHVGQGGSARAAGAVVTALESAGWTPRNDDWAPDGIHAGGTRWDIYLSRDGVEARVGMQADSEIVLMSARGPCIPPPDGKEPPLASKELELPGAVPLTDLPTEDEGGRPLPGMNGS